MKEYKIEWSLSLLNKYSVVVLENEFKNMKITKTMMFFIIHLKHRPGIHQDKLAEMFKMNRSTVTRAIEQLISQKYIAKAVDEDNKKAYKIYLTDEGDKLYNYMMKALLDWVSILTEGMTQEEVDMSVHLLTKMAGNACRHLGDDKLADLIEGGR